MALSVEHSDGLHTSQSPSSGKDDNSLSSDYSSSGIRIGSNEQEHPNEFVIGRGQMSSTGDQYSAAPTGLTYDYVSPEALCKKVKLFLTDLLPVTEIPEDLQVEYIGMGSYHKVVGFKVPMPKAATNGIDNPLFEGGEYVVRIQYLDETDANTDMERDVAILNGLAGKIDVPIPRILTFDIEKTNPLDAAYTVATRLPGITLESITEDEDFTTEQNISMVEQVTFLVEKLTSITAPYPGLITSTHGGGMSKTFCPSGIPMTMFDFPFDTLPLTTLANPSPLTFMLALVHHWTTYEAAHLPSEDGNFASWMKIKAIIHTLSRLDLLGSIFHLVHGDLAARNILGTVIDDSTLEITGVVDWDFASFAPAFCAYRAPLYIWSGGEDDANMWCEPEVVEAFKNVASPEYLKYAFAEEALIVRKVWWVLRDVMVGNYRRTYAAKVFQEWEWLHPEDRIGEVCS